MKEKILEDLKRAMREKNIEETSVLRMLLSSMHNKAIEKRTRGDSEELTDDEVSRVMKSEAKKRDDAIEEFTKGNRSDLADKEKREREILVRYLPAEMSDADLEHAVVSAIAEIGGATMKDFGKIMKAVVQKTGGAARGDRISAAVKKLLS